MRRVKAWIFGGAKHRALIATMGSLALCLMMGAGCADDSASNNNQWPIPTNNPTNNQNNTNNTVNNTTNNWLNNTPGDMSSPQDMSGSDMGGEEDMVQQPLARYNPALDDLGEPSSTCATSLIDATLGQQATLRQFMTSYRVDALALADHKRYREAVHRFVFEHIAPCRLAGAPNMVIWPGGMSLPTLLIGPKAAAARGQGDPSNALAQLLNDLSVAAGYYTTKFPEASLAQNVQLALTDSTVRAIWDTYGPIAARYGLYMGLTVQLPQFERSTDPALIRMLGDPDYIELDHVYVATSSTIRSQFLLFGPDGRLMNMQPRAYVTPREQEVLSLEPSSFDQLRPLELPWGRMGVLEGAMAWMPDVQDRLDDLGATRYAHLAANEGGWVAPPERDERVWRPDGFMFGAWSLVQRSPRALGALASTLTGRLLDVSFDGQVQATIKAAHAPQAQRFVGQDQEQAASLFVGPWAFEDGPGDDVAARRQALRVAAQGLTPSAYVQGAWAVDLASSKADTQVQTHVAAAALYSGAQLVASSAGAVGQRKLKLELYSQGQLSASELIAAPPGAELVRPQLAVSALDEVFIVAEAVALDGSFNKLYMVRYDAQMRKVINAELLDTRADFNYQPWLWRVGRRLLLSWTQSSGDRNRAVLMQGSLSTTNVKVFANATPQPIEAPAMARQLIPLANQWGVRVAATVDALAAVWLDYEQGRWSVVCAISVDGGLSWSVPQRVDQSADGVASLHESPSIVAHGSGFVITWVDKSQERPGAHVMVRPLEIVQGGYPSLGPAFEVSQDEWAYRPDLRVGLLGELGLVYEGLDRSLKPYIERVKLEPRQGVATDRLRHEAQEGSAHFPRLLLDGSVFYEQVGDDGSSQVKRF